MPLIQNRAVGRPARQRLTMVRVRLCSSHCSVCLGQHRFTEPLDATRIDCNRVRITTPDDVWHGAIVGKSDYEFYEASACLVGTDAWKAKGADVPWIVAANSRTGVTQHLTADAADYRRCSGRILAKV